MKIIAWNIAQRPAAWRCLANSDADVALLQEATDPPADLKAKIGCDTEPWQCAGGSPKWRAAVVKLSNRAEVQWLDAKPLAEAQGGELGISRPGTLAAAVVAPPQGEPFIAVSVYGQWEVPHGLTRSKFIYADASVHRLISDLSVFLAKKPKQGILIAGDLNISLRIRRGQRPILGIAIRHGLRQNGGAGSLIRWATSPRRPASRALAG